MWEFRTCLNILINNTHFGFDSTNPSFVYNLTKDEVFGPSCWAIFVLEIRLKKSWYQQLKIKQATNLRRSPTLSFSFQELCLFNKNLDLILYILLFFIPTHCLPLILEFQLRNPIKLKVHWDDLNIEFIKFKRFETFVYFKDCCQFQEKLISLYQQSLSSLHLIA